MQLDWLLRTLKIFASFGHRVSMANETLHLSSILWIIFLHVIVWLTYISFFFSCDTSYRWHARYTYTYHLLSFLLFQQLSSPMLFWEFSLAFLFLQICVDIFLTYSIIYMFKIFSNKESLFQSVNIGALARFRFSCQFFYYAPVQLRRRIHIILEVKLIHSRYFH